jgi:ABC-type proline/glycine betaine transport system ATPase subunit
MDENFYDRTVLILASKFRHVVRADQIMVMSHGKVVELDTPLALLSNPKSKFSLMVSQTGEMDFQKLYDMAAAHSAEGAYAGSGLRMPRSLDIFTPAHSSTGSLASAAAPAASAAQALARRAR